MLQIQDETSFLREIQNDVPQKEVLAPIFDVVNKSVIALLDIIQISSCRLTLSALQTRIKLQMQNISFNFPDVESEISE